MLLFCLFCCQAHLKKAAIASDKNLWDQPLSLTSRSRPRSAERERNGGSGSGYSSTGTSNDAAARVHAIAAEAYLPFHISSPLNRSAADAAAAEAVAAAAKGDGSDSPCPPPAAYSTAAGARRAAVSALREGLRGRGVEHAQLQAFTESMQARYNEWILSTGNVRQLSELTHTAAAVAPPA